MVKNFVVIALCALLLATTAYAATCQSITSFAPSCVGGSITQDTTDGACRTLVCASGGSSMKVLACEKPDGGAPQHFELYKQTVTGSGIAKVCLGSTCIGEHGFVKSPAYTCGSTPTTPACTPTTEVCDGKDNNCNGQSDENNVCAQTCYANINSLPATCTGRSITLDSKETCRTIVCKSGSQSLQVLACNKPDTASAPQHMEMYRQASSGNLKICLGTTCIQGNGFAKSPNFPICQGGSAPATPTPPACTPTTEVCDGKDNNCNGQSDENNVCAPPSQSTFPLKTNIIATQFWVGQGPSADTGWTHNYDSAWDVWWQEHYGGFDDPNSRNGWHPAAFTPKENPFYVALPYTDFSNVGRKSNAFQVVPWANEKSSWGYQESMIKNRWVKVIKGAKTVYAQVENSGPGPTDDWQYVFGSNPQPTTNFGWKAGIDVSPAIRDYLGLGPVDVVSWQWVKASDVPAGPWKNIVTTRQSCWDSTQCP